MKIGKRSIVTSCTALLLSAMCVSTALAAGPAPDGDAACDCGACGCGSDCVTEAVTLAPPIAKDTVGAALDVSILGRGTDAWIGDGELACYTAYVRNDTEDPWEGDVYFTVPVLDANVVMASGDPEQKGGLLTWSNVCLDPFEGIEYYIIVNNAGNILPESFLATLSVSGHDGFPSSHANLDGWCGVPELSVNTVRKADREILEIRNDAMKGGASRVRVQLKGYVGDDLAGHEAYTYNADDDITEVMLGGLSACGGAEAPGLSLDVTGLEVTGIRFDACGETDFAMGFDAATKAWTMPDIKG